MEEKIIKWIAQRIKDEHIKHAKNIDNWEEIAARKIVATYNVTLRQSDVIKSVCESCGEVNDCHHSKCTLCLAKAFRL